MYIHKLTSSILVAVIISIFGYCGFSEASFADEVNQIENELNSSNRKVNITDEIEKEAKETIDETCEGKYICTPAGMIIESPIDEKALEEDGTIEQENISYDGDIRGDGLHLVGAYQGLTYYSQADSRWANKVYSSIGDPNQTMKSSGCGPTVAAMVVSSSKGTILPTTMADLFVSNGYRTAANGTAWSAFPFVADYFGFNNYVYTANLNTAIDYLRQGYFVIVSCGNGLFTTNGHYIVLVGINGDTLSIYDPYMYSGKFNTASRRGKVTVSGNTVYCSINNFAKFANYRAFWCYSNDHGSGNENAGSGSSYSAGSYEIATDVLRVRSGPGTNYNIVSRLYRGSRQDIDYAVGNWGHLSNNAGWICLDYCTKVISSNTSTNSDYSAGSYQVTTDILRVRSGPGTNYRIVARICRGSLQGVDYTRENWGHLMNNAGWICLDYCSRINGTNTDSRYFPGNYQVTASALRIRSGAGTQFRIVSRLYRGNIQSIDYTYGDWGHLMNDRGWICLNYCKKV